MNKFTRTLLVAAACLSMLGNTTLALAQSTATLCKPEGTVFLFFNGVNTTKHEGDIALFELQRIYGAKDSIGEDMRYELMYNVSNGLEDFVETFQQRLAEQDGILSGKFELFFETIRGSGNWWDRLTGAISSLSQIRTALTDLVLATGVRSLTSLVATPPTEVMYQDHRSRLDTYSVEGRKLLLFAHSQGNLFANVAFKHLRKTLPDAAVKLIHVAPASPQLNGFHVLADLDLVINALRLTGTVASVTHSIPNPLARPANWDGKKDPLGHGLLEIYVNPNLQISGAVKGLVEQGLASLVAPPIGATPGFFTATVTWDGPGDVDTHVQEPDGSHVWYGNKLGRSGHLDVDNTEGFGPEHYFATCDATRLQTGSYKVSLANYLRAEGRSVNVQIASHGAGVLKTKTLVLGAATGSIPSVDVFTVNITTDANGKFKATVD